MREVPPDTDQSSGARQQGYRRRGVDAGELRLHVGHYPAVAFEEGDIGMNDITPYLFGFTLIVALLICVWQFTRVRRAQKLNTPAVQGVPQPDGSVKGEERAVRH
jgi:hypothetical protein